MSQLFPRAVRWPAVSMVTRHELDQDIGFCVGVSDALELNLTRR